MARRWLYPNWSTPPALTDDIPLKEFPQWADVVRKPWRPVAQWDWPWVPIPTPEIPRVYTQWQEPVRPKPHTPGEFSWVDIERQAAVEIQWHTPFTPRPRRLPWLPFVPPPAPPPPQTDPLPPWEPWAVVMRKKRMPIQWPDQPWVPTGGGFPLFIPNRWEIPRLRKRIVEPFGDMDFEAREVEHGVLDFTEPQWPPPPPRRPNPVPYVPIVVPDELFVPFVPNCPRPLRRPDTKC